MGIGLNAQTVPAAVSSFKLDYKLTTVRSDCFVIARNDDRILREGNNLEQVRKPTNKSMFESREKGSIRHCTIL